MIYISGPMTGCPGLNFETFDRAAEKLRAAGFEVLNPAELNPDPDMPWDQCLRRDIVALMDCDSIVMLPGWARSKGACLEFHVAVQLGMTIYHGLDQLLLEATTA